MSSVTRVGFLIPAVNDQADEILYHDSNIPTYEAELPSLVVGSLPVVSNYAGRIRALNNPQTTNPPFPSLPYDEFVYTGSAWIPYSSAGLKRQLNTATFGNSGSVNTSGPEVFSSVMPGFSAMDAQAGSIIKFMVMVHLAANGNDTTFNGKLNIFVNPTSSGQPGPLTPGAARLSFPMVESSDIYAYTGTTAPLDAFYGEMLYPSTYTGTIGVGAYLSATNTYGGSGYIHDPALDSILPAYGCMVLTETSGTWSG